MTERRTESPSTERSRREVGEEIMTNIETTEITVRPAAASFASYIRDRVEDFDGLGADEVVELTFAFHAEWQGSDERRAEREEAKARREVEQAAKRAEREAAKRERLAEEKAKLEEKLAKLSK